MSAVPSRAVSLKAVEWTVTSIVIVVVSCRLYIRIFRRKNAGWDDVAAVAAATFSISTTAQQSTMTHYGFAKHVEDIPPSNIELLTAWQWATELQFFAGFFFARLAVHLFLFRLIARAHTWTRWVVWVALAVNVVTIIVIIILFCVLCIPTQGLWNKSIHATCLPRSTQGVISQASAVLAIVNDCLCATIPIIIVRKLNLPRHKKVAIALALGMGYIVAVCSTIRVILSTNTGQDPFWQIIPVTYIGALELGLGVIVASIPALSSMFLGSWQVLTWKRLRHIFHARRRNNDGGGSRSKAVDNDWDLPTPAEQEAWDHEFSMQGSLLPRHVVVKSTDVTVEETLREADDHKAPVAVWEF